jgi:hypothetical protein
VSRPNNGKGGNSQAYLQ